MFKKRTAWFSNSVRRGARRFWVSEGGAITSWRNADYLFSEDASSPDTTSVFESKDYAENRLTVFHSFYLAACEKCLSVKSVCIGHYVLPPVTVQEEVRALVGRFIWEQEENVQAVDTEDSDDHTELDYDLEEEDCSTDNIDMSTCSKEVPIQNTPATTEREETLCCEVQDYPMNNMITGYVSIDEMRIFSGKLEDFIPGHCGSFVHRKRQPTVDLA
ncbi:hypothetical protein DPEC_G00346510 [Dallia pectoralis]|uniref:Uncharacterized protein n=1 Tax=Dallia pectoralis TaxID=75939 RepID=A0ACC2F3S1_DALPE|nr:hypothetical protein DPEC_G00346510 [Dallia pectoralis]